MQAAPAGAQSTTLADLGVCKTSYPTYLTNLQCAPSFLASVVMCLQLQRWACIAHDFCRCWTL